MILPKIAQPCEFWSGVRVNIYVSIWGYFDAVKVLSVMSEFLNR